MEINVELLPKSRAKVTVEVSPEEAKPHLETAASKLSKEKPIDGFRPGHAPYNAVVRAYGEMAVYETAMQTIVIKTYATAIKDHKLETYGEPHVDITKLVPGEPIGFTATVTLIPKVLELADISKANTKPEPKKIKDEEVDKAIAEVCKMRTNEAAVDREAKEGDKVVVDMDMKLNGVDLEGGQARDHGIYLDEDYYIPGLKDKLLGAKVGQNLKFNLKFPEDHFQKNIAGKEVEFLITMKQVFELTPPAADDELAKSLGQESLQALKDLIRGNMEKEAEDQALHKAEDQAIEKLIAATKFEDIPDDMVNAEIDRMIHELEHDLQGKNIQFDEYLKKAGKNLGQIKMDFAGPALKRVQAALMMRSLGDSLEIEVSDKDILDEQNRLVNNYPDDAEAQKKIRSTDFADYLKASLRNRKVMEHIHENALGVKPEETEKEKAA